MAAPVASIRARVVQGKRRVTVKGRLVAADLRRLERACGPALEQRELSLEVRFVEAEVGDEPARLFLQNLAKRGADFTLP
jgi:hypothetical protein